MADAGEGPHVVQSPHNGLARCYNLLDVLQRQESLVYPVQMNHVCLLEFGQFGNVGACVGYVNLKKIVLLEFVSHPNNRAFPHKLHLMSYRRVECHNGNLVSLFIPYKHFCLYAIVFQSLHKSVGCDGCSAYAF